MTLTIEVSAELEIKLEAEANSGGVSKNEFVRIILEEKLNVKKARRLPVEGRVIATNLPVRDRSREHAWLAKNRDEFDGQYVALDGDRLLAHGLSLKEVAFKARELGVQDAYVVLVEGSRTLPHVGDVW